MVIQLIMLIFAEIKWLNCLNVLIYENRREI
nr:MAG TPA: hypothetical protein [Caudoviricetes sp.]